METPGERRPQLDKINRLFVAGVIYLWMAPREPGILAAESEHPLLVPLQLDVPLSDVAERDHHP